MFYFPLYARFLKENLLDSFISHYIGRLRSPCIPVSRFLNDPMDTEFLNEFKVGCINLLEYFEKDRSDFSGGFGLNQSGLSFLFKDFQIESLDLINIYNAQKITFLNFIYEYSSVKEIINATIIEIEEFYSGLLIGFCNSFFFGIKGTREEIDKLHDQLNKERALNNHQIKFISIASHELKSPLTTVKAYMDLIKSLHPENNPVNNYLNKSGVLINKIEDLLSDFLDIVRIKTGKLHFYAQKFNFDELIDEVIDQARVVSPNIGIEKSGVKNTMILGDRKRLEQVVVNLLNNSIKYSMGQKYISISQKISSGKFEVSVGDNGIGIPKAEIKKVFEKFYRVQESRHDATGHGLGLHIASEIIKWHKGNIWVESEVGKGSIFSFSLPL